MEAIASLWISHDLSALEDEYYLEVDPSMSVTENADRTFKHASSKLNLANELTEEEEKMFEKRFVEEMEYEAAQDHTLEKTSKDEMQATWKKEARAAFEHQKPVQTEALVERVNAAGKMPMIESCQNVEFTPLLLQGNSLSTIEIQDGGSCGPQESSLVAGR